VFDGLYATNIAILYPLTVALIAGAAELGAWFRQRSHVLADEAPVGPLGGAFTKALLDSFNDPAADTNRNGLISTTGLATYLNRRVPTLTDGKQTPGMEVRFDTTVFAVGQ
jgi:hypothetical protein